MSAVIDIREKQRQREHERLMRAEFENPRTVWDRAVRDASVAEDFDELDRLIAIPERLRKDYAE